MLSIISILTFNHFDNLFYKMIINGHYLKHCLDFFWKCTNDSIHLRS
jgi:hypothetical protein